MSKFNKDGGILQIENLKFKMEKERRQGRYRAGLLNV